MVDVITSISPAGHGIFKQISIPSHDPVQNSRFRGRHGMAKPLKKSAPQGSHPFPQPGAEPERFDSLAFAFFYLQPMDGPDIERNTHLAVNYCLSHPQWRLSLQTHKLLDIP